LLKAGVIGASGYTGVELLRILSAHPAFEVALATARQYAGEPIDSLYPSLAGTCSGSFEQFDPESAAETCDVFFLGLPHGEGFKAAAALANYGKPVVDLSADFRLEDRAEYEKWYGAAHGAPELLSDAVYGVPEINRDEVASARLTANPGCYPTAALLGLYPLARAGMLKGQVVVDAKSGVSGAGRSLTLATHYPQIADGMQPYAVSGHRHLPEIRGQLKKLGAEVDVVLAPHLAPMNRGILCTTYLRIEGAADRVGLRALYENAYNGESFVRLLPDGDYPQTKAVQGSNNCQVALEFPDGGSTLVVMSAIDNLVKGAAGQAVQNMNLMCGLEETAGLAGPGIFP
jgi:N-acetyl-gamma-glutamyl-phosphate reductase